MPDGAPVNDDYFILKIHYLCCSSKFTLISLSVFIICAQNHAIVVTFFGGRSPKAEWFIC